METKTFVAAGIVLAILIGLAAVFLASPNPDGLESTALIVQGDKTLTGDTPPDAEVNEDTADRFSYEAPLPDYSMGVGMGKTGEIIALVAGVLVTFLVILGISRVVSRPVK